MKRLCLVLALLAPLPVAAAAASHDDNICALQLPPLKPGGKPRPLKYLDVYVGDPAPPRQDLKPESYIISAQRVRDVWPVGGDDPVFIECRYAGGESIHVAVPRDAQICEAQSYRLSRRHRYRFEFVACR